jgi:hypothetical protein
MVLRASRRIPSRLRDAGRPRRLRTRSDPRREFVEMRTVRHAVACAVLVLAAATASAEKLKGFLWETSPSAIVVDGEKVALTADTRVGYLRNQ